MSRVVLIQRFVTCLALAIFTTKAAAEALPPKVFSADPQVLAAAKVSLARGDASLQPAYQKLISEAKKALSMTPPSVMDKQRMPPSGDKHDYVSQAPYFWLDTNSPGNKYIRRDGERNPDSERDSDAGRLVKACNSTHTLALAYYFSGDEKYAAKAADLIRVFFLNPATRMNPNLNYGQGIPGEVDGRPTGLIGARCLVDLVDAIGLLAGSKAWSAADQQGITLWISQYFHWLTTSKIGRGEAAAKNNHGSFYDVQATALALFLGENDFAKKLVLAAETNRIARQIEPDGREPLELARTLSFGYSLFNLRALSELADLGRNVGVDLWHYETPDGRSLLKGLKLMAPYANPQSHWPYQQIHNPNRDDLDLLLLHAATEYPGELDGALKFVPAADFEDSTTRLIYKIAGPAVG